MSLDLVDFKRNNWGLYIVIGVVVLALIFLPDYISEKKRNLTNQTKQSEALQEQKEAEEKAEEEVVEEVEAYVDPLAIQGAEEADPVEVKEEISEEVVEESSESEAETEDPTAQVSNQVRATPTAEPTVKPLLSLDAVSWSNLHEGSVVSVLNDLKNKTEALARVLPERYVDSRYALYNYADGIKYLLGNNEREMPAVKALLYLEYLDKEVTRTFIRERVARCYFVDWAHVSLTALLGRNSADSFKLMAQPKYNPNLLLTRVDISVPFSLNSKKGEDLYKSSVFSFKGIVVGNDIATVEVFRNGQSVRAFNIRKLSSVQEKMKGNNEKFKLKFYDNKEPEKNNNNQNSQVAENDVFEFTIDRATLNGFYAIRVTNTEGLKYIKTYKFEEAFNLRRWRFDEEKKQFVFLYKATQQQKTKVDDAFKLVKTGRTEIDGFITSGDNSGFETY